MSKTVVIIVNYYGAEDTAECIRSIMAGRSIPRIVVVDNSPNDVNLNTVLSAYPGVHLLTMAENAGFGRGNNRGIRWAMMHTDCEYIMLLNNDATCEQNAISLCEAELDRDITVGIVAPRIAYYHDPDSLWYGGGEISWGRGSAKIPGFRGSARSAIAMRERDVTFASGCAMLVRCEVFKQVGGFDPRFFMYEEDTEFCLRVQEAGWRLRYLPKAFVLHKVQGGNKQESAVVHSILSPRNPKLSFYLFHVIRNRLLNMFIHAEGRNLFVFLSLFPLYWTKQILGYVYYHRFDGIAAILKGITSFYRERHKPFVNELVSEVG